MKNSLSFNDNRTINQEGNCSVLYVHKDGLTDKSIEMLERMRTNHRFAGARIAIMPDFEMYDKNHATGYSITFPPNKAECIPPDILGNDIGCGVLLVKTDAKVNQIDLKKLDDYIKFDLFNEKNRQDISEELKKKLDYFKLLFSEQEFADIINSYATLGQGNHFIEADKDNNDNLYIAIHTGSRKLGFYTAQIYKAIQGRKEKPQFFSFMEISQLANDFAKSNRLVIAGNILKKFNLSLTEVIDCPHNYISDDYTVHKGSISANKDEKIIIPLNMRDGIILGTGKGNPKWNNSAPHGSGRRLSRSEAKAEISITDYIRAMNGIYSSSISRKTLDEAPQAYNDTKETIEAIKPTVSIRQILQPIYNYKRK